MIRNAKDESFEATNHHLCLHWDLSLCFDLQSDVLALPGCRILRALMCLPTSSSRLPSFSTHLSYPITQCPKCMLPVKRRIQHLSLGQPGQNSVPFKS